MVALIVAFFLVGSKSAEPTPAGFGAAPPGVVAAVTNPSAAVVMSVGGGGQPGNLNRVTGTTVLRDSDGKPQIVYVGAEYCPYCAAERWSMVMALARFGTFTNLQESTSSSTDVDPNTVTLAFHGGTYTSSILDFQHVELEDRNQQPFESPSAHISEVFNAVNQPPFTGSRGGLPFLDIAGRFTLESRGFDPALLQGLTWEQVAADLANANSPVTQAIVGHANYLTAAICSVTKNKPSSACSMPVIQNLEAGLGSQSPVG